MLLRKSWIIRLALEIYGCTALPRVFPTLKHLVALTHRVNLVDKLARLLIIDILNEAYAQNISLWAKQPARWNTYQDAIQDIKPYFLLLGHFLEAFRANFVYLLSVGFYQHDIAALLSGWVLRHYTPYASLRVCLAYRDLMSKLARKLRPPSYANSAERGLRGWTRDPAKPEDCQDIAVFGGLEAVYGIMSIAGYRNRMRAMDRFLSEQSGRLGKGKQYTVATPTMPPLTRCLAKTLHAQLLSPFSPLLVHNNTRLQDLTPAPSAEGDPSGETIHYDAGFGCHVFAAGYEPDPSSFTDANAEGGENLSLIANQPLHHDPNPDYDMLTDRLPKAVGRRPCQPTSEVDLERN
ncbi:MAG: hypothetical protein Q9191_002841 [Dirinaria sp. TL-2023a]